MLAAGLGMGGLVLLGGGLDFFDVRTFEDLVDGLLFAHLDEEVGQGIAILGHFLLQTLGAAALLISKRRDAVVQLAFADIHLELLGYLLENEEGFQFANGFILSAGTKLLDVLLDSLARDAFHEQIDSAAVDDAVGLAVGELGGELDFDLAEELVDDLAAHGRFYVEIDALDHLIAQGIAELLLVGEAQALEEFFVDLDGLEFFDVLDGHFERDILAAEGLVGMIVGDFDVDIFSVAGFGAGQLGREVVDLDAENSAGAHVDRGIVLMRDHFAIDLHMQIADDLVALLDAAVLDGCERALLLAEVLHGLLKPFNSGRVMSG